MIDGLQDLFKTTEPLLFVLNIEHKFNFYVSMFVHNYFIVSLSENFISPLDINIIKSHLKSTQWKMKSQISKINDVMQKSLYYTWDLDNYDGIRVNHEHTITNKTTSG